VGWEPFRGEEPFSRYDGTAERGFGFRGGGEETVPSGEGGLETEMF
jgi:hypothetical protein